MTTDVAATGERNGEGAAPGRQPWLFAAVIFASAGLVFLVEPMVAKLVLPLLGGSPMVWNTSLAFFQAALLAGYAYAHLLQKIPSLRRQLIVHLAVLAAAALALPLRISGLLGEPSSTAPAFWLLGVLVVSLGAPFAALSATAPLVQAWRARTSGEGEAQPWALYAASNLGSLIALLAYPVIVEPLLALNVQRAGWSLGYMAFIGLMGALVWRLWTAHAAAPAPVAEAADAPPVTWRQRLTWLALAALPSSLMLGVTQHLATDVASAPFLWVAPLALYLTTFIIAFQDRPLIPRPIALVLQGGAVAACAFNLPFHATTVVELLVQIVVHLGAFFLSALVCHQALVARRPAPARLTEFYLWMSLGGVVGGAFNAFAAPLIFSTVLEYPIVLLATCLARPWGDGGASPRDWAVFIAGVLASVAAVLSFHFLWGVFDLATLHTVEKVLLGVAVISVFLLRDRAWLTMGLAVILALCANAVGDKARVLHYWRSFFGVLRMSHYVDPRMGGEIRSLAHGTTLHGAQALDPRFRCRPLVYYAPETPIGQVFADGHRRAAALRMGVVGLGTGTSAAWVRPTDHLTFFEIDPLVIKVATDPANFTYTTECARGRVDYVLGDARLTLARQPAGEFDILLIDAFSSDAVPAHLLTVEAIRGYLSHLKPDGALVLHLSNRNLDLRSPAMAAARAAGGYALLQRHIADRKAPDKWESDEDALLIVRSPQVLARWRADPRWEPSDPTRARPWTDDYTNLMGALVGRLRERMAGE